MLRFDRKQQNSVKQLSFNKILKELKEQANTHTHEILQVSCMEKEWIYIYMYMYMYI